MAHAGFETPSEALDFIFSGKAVVTLSSTSGTHFTFKVSAGKDGGIFFVNYLYGPNNAAWGGDWAYSGFVKSDDDGNPTTGLIAGRKGTPDAVSFKAFQWALAHLKHGHIPDTLTIQHNVTCGVCGRELTDPISVATGIGPICRSK
jgi:hypothetical protein